MDQRHHNRGSVDVPTADSAETRHLGTGDMGLQAIEPLALQVDCGHEDGRALTGRDRSGDDLEPDVGLACSGHCLHYATPARAHPRSDRAHLPRQEGQQTGLPGRRGLELTLP